MPWKEDAKPDVQFLGFKRLYCPVKAFLLI